VLVRALVPQRQMAMSWEGTEEPAPEPQQRGTRSRWAKAPELHERPSKRQRSPAAGVVKAAVARYALKVLCNDELTKAILGPKGMKKDEIQELSQARLVFSNKGDYFPDTQYRVLVIYAKENACILLALEPIVQMLSECGDKERQHPHANGPDMVGKEHGEYVVRLAIGKLTATALIGPSGANIKKLRADAHVKLFVENRTVHGHQMVRVIGQPEAIFAGLEKVNEYVQNDVGSDAYYEWSKLVNFGELAWNKEAPPHSQARESRPLSWEPAPSWQTVPPPQFAGTREAPVDSFVDYRRASGVDESTGVPGVDRLVEVVKSMPPGTPDVAYSMTFPLPEGCDSPEFFQHLEKVTGAAIKDGEVTDNGERHVDLQGPLMSIYAAHMLMIKKAVDLEREQRAEAQRRGRSEGQPSVEEMQQQVLDLQRQLKEAQGGNLGGEGKSKGKGDGQSEMKGKVMVLQSCVIQYFRKVPANM
jgi:hypothetical protein